MLLFENEQIALPDMKVSPMFVEWQHEKPRVITDHAATGLNEGIPKDEATKSTFSYCKLELIFSCVLYFL
jgi:hypothetical protein